MFRIVNFRLLGLVGLFFPGALGDTHCGDVKTFYKENKCCKSPTKTVDVGSLCGGGNTIDEIHERKKLKCGVKNSQFGMGYENATTKEYSGLDIEYCKGVAAALGVDEVEYVIASASDRFKKLEDKEIDVLIRTTTWTTERDAELKADFAAINFYDGQSILVSSGKFSKEDSSASQLGGARICVEKDSTSEGNVKDFFITKGITVEIVASEGEAEDKFVDGVCDAITGDKSALVATKHKLDNSDIGIDTWITTEQLSKEPLAAATRDNDADFNEVVTWTWHGMVTAEEMNITQSNYEQVAAESCPGGAKMNPAKCRFLTTNMGLGSAKHPLDDDWMQHVLGAVGNYGEAYSRAFCSSGTCLIDRDGSKNALANEGGLMFSPPMRR